MARLLSPVLTVAEFDPAELSAMLLDGEAYRVADSVAPIDEIPGPLVRASALAVQLPPRLIAEQHSAAWIWGALSQPPLPHEVCSNIAARTRPSLDVALNVREVVLQPGDIVRVGDLDVTTPLRTAVDIARFVVDWTEGETEILRRLAAFGDFAVEDCKRFMDRRRNLPGKRMAMTRIASSLSDAGSASASPS